MPAEEYLVYCPRLIEDELMMLDADELLAKHRRKTEGIDQLQVNSIGFSASNAVFHSSVTQAITDRIHRTTCQLASAPHTRPFKKSTRQRRRPPRAARTSRNSTRILLLLQPFDHPPSSHQRPLVG